MARPLSHSHRRSTVNGGRSRLIMLVALVACAAAAVGTAEAASSPQSLRASILKAALAKHSVRYVTVSSGNGARMKMVSDVAGSKGIQRVTLSKNGRTGHATTMVVNSTGYIRGDAFALHVYMGFPQSFATRYAGQWISIPHTSPLYPPVAVDVTFGSFVSHMLPQGHLSLVSGTVGGKRLRGLRGTSVEGPGHLTVYVSTSGNPLPVEGQIVGSGAHPATTRVSMNRWNETVHVQAPAQATPLPGS